jgi:hypothetical protein
MHELYPPAGSLSTANSKSSTDQEENSADPYGEILFFRGAAIILTLVAGVATMVIHAAYKASEPAQVVTALPEGR